MARIKSTKKNEKRRKKTGKLPAIVKTWYETITTQLSTLLQPLLLTLVEQPTRATQLFAWLVYIDAQANMINSIQNLYNWGHNLKQNVLCIVKMKSYLTGLANLSARLPFTIVTFALALNRCFNDY
uniref:Uncharacterized protein n=1 Tax=Glossina pallidipes TaxID=7398 RepID=A0A1A9ZDX9_GLOPL